MQVITGDETGLIKLIDLKRKVVASKCGLQCRDNGVIASVVVPGGVSTVAVYTNSGNVELWDTVAQAQIHICHNAGEEGLLFSLWNGQFITVTTAGDVRVFPIMAKDAESTGKKFNVGGRLQGAKMHPTTPILAVGGREHDLQLWDVTSQTKVFQARNVPNDYLDRRVPVWISGIAFIPTAAAAAIAAKAEEEEKEAAAAAAKAAEELHLALAAEAAAAASKSKSKKSKDTETVATVAKPTLGKTAAEAFAVAAAYAAQITKAHHGLDTWKSSSPFCIVAITAYKQIRVYDCRISPRPLRSVECGEHCLTLVEPSLDFAHLFVGDSIGTLARLEMGAKGSLRVTGGYHGAAGNISAVAQHPTKKYLAAVSLDRCLYVWDIDTREKLRRLYLKQRMNTVMWTSPKNAKDDESDDELEPDRPTPKQFRITGMADVKAAKIVGAGVSKLKEKGEDDEDEDDDEESGSGEASDEDLSADDDAVWRELDRRRKKASAVDAKVEEEDDEEEDDDDDDDDDSMLDFDDGDEDEDDDDEDEEEEEESADDKPKGKKPKLKHPGADSDDEAFVDSHTAARTLRKQVSDTRRSNERDVRRAAAAPKRGGKVKPAPPRRR